MMKGGLAGLMKQAQQMQEKMKAAQEQLTALEVTGQAAGGLVKVTLRRNGRSRDARRSHCDGLYRSL